MSKEPFSAEAAEPAKEKTLCGFCGFCGEELLLKPVYGLITAAVV